MSVTIDVVLPTEEPFFVLEGSRRSTGNGLVGVLGQIYLTLYGLAQQSPRIQSRTFLLALQSQLSSLNSRMYLQLPFSLSNSLIMQAGARNIGISVDARVTAFRAGSNDPEAGFAGVDLRDPVLSDTCYLAIENSWWTNKYPENVPQFHTSRLDSRVGPLHCLAPPRVAIPVPNNSQHTKPCKCLIVFSARLPE
jgi:hypothetical protein